MRPRPSPSTPLRPAQRFECSVDTGSPNFGPCSGPGAAHTPPSPLSEGAHTFRVRATDAANNTDPTPASSTFTTVLDPPAHDHSHQPARWRNRGNPYGSDRRRLRPGDEQALRRGRLLAEADQRRRRGCRAFGWYGNALIFIPSAPLANAHHLHRQREHRRPGATANPLPAPRSWQFTTATQPLITAVSPADSAIEVLPNGFVVAVFDTGDGQALRPGRLLAEAHQRRRRGRGVPSGWYGNALIFKPELRPRRRDANTPPPSRTAAKDLAGHPLPGAEDLALHHYQPPDHRTRPPRRRRRPASPAPASTLALFNKAMDKPSTREADLTINADSSAPTATNDSAGELRLLSRWQRLIFKPNSDGRTSHPVHRRRALTAVGSQRLGQGNPYAGCGERGGHRPTTHETD